MFKVLFISPNHDTEPRIPLAPAILMACLKEAGAEVKLFDTTFMLRNANASNAFKEKKGLVLKTDLDEQFGPIEEVDPKEKLAELLREFKPDLVAMTLVEFNFALGMQLLGVVKQAGPTPTLVGGIMPIIAPEMVLAQPSVDMICIGEGESTVVELVRRMETGKSYADLANLWVKTGEAVLRNPRGSLADVNAVPFQDWSQFDDRCLFKAYQGKVYRAGTFELSRGCLMNCSFCVAPAIRKGLSEGQAKGYHRFKTPERLVAEIVTLKSAYNLDMVHFADTNWLLRLPFGTLQRLHDLWLEQVRLPFMIQTGADTLNEQNLSLLKAMGCVTMSIGVESGSSRVRSQVMNKKLSDDVYLRAFDLAKKASIRTTANFIIGLPFETEEDVWKSIEFNRRLNPPSIAVHYFTPFVGTKLYDICLKEGYITGFDPEADVYRESRLSTSTLSKERINELLDIFIDDYNKHRSA